MAGSVVQYYIPPESLLTWRPYIPVIVEGEFKEAGMEDKETVEWLEHPKLDAMMAYHRLEGGTAKQALGPVGYHPWLRACRRGLRFFLVCLQCG